MDELQWERFNGLLDKVVGLVLAQQARSAATAASGPPSAPPDIGSTIEALKAFGVTLTPEQQAALAKLVGK